jgi:hypothetical protein
VKIGFFASCLNPNSPHGACVANGWTALLASIFRLDSLSPEEPRFCIWQVLGFLAWLTIMEASEASAHWVLPAELQKVPILNNCAMTHHGVAASIQPNLLYPSGAIFLCPSRVSEIDKRHPGAARFFLLHEYGHLALRTREEAVADTWAAKQLAKLPAERGALRSVLMHFVEQGSVFDPAYGTGLDRAFRVAQAAQLPQSEWPAELRSYAKTQVVENGNRATLTLQAGDGYANAAEMTLYLDQHPLGFLSNVDEVKVLTLPSLSPGRHLLQAEQVWIFHRETDAGKTEIARGLRAETEFEPMGKRLALTFRFDGESVTIRIIANR